MSWKDDKNLGPWSFEKQPDKLHCNQGDRISSVEDPTFSMDFTGEPVTPTHKPCGYWHSVPKSRFPKFGPAPDVTTGVLWGCGTNSDYQLGNIGGFYHQIFMLLSPGDCQVISAAGWSHAHIITKNKILMGAGRNDRAQLGVGDKLARTSFIVIDGNLWQDVSAGFHSTIALRVDGTLYGTGLNSSGELGLEDENERLSFTYIRANVKRISFRASSSIIITDDGDLYGSGNNTSGELGLGNQISRNQFTRISAAGNWIEVSVGGSHVLALKETGDLHGWGYNAYGQLGLGDTVMRTSPTFITGGVAKIEGGLFFNSYIIKTDGTLWTAGQNSAGALGLGDSTPRYSFTQVGSATDWAYISSGIDFAVAIKNDGSIHSMGTNNYGQLGLGDTTNRSYPTEVPLITCLDLFTGCSNTYIVRGQ